MSSKSISKITKAELKREYDRVVVELAITKKRYNRQIRKINREKYNEKRDRVAKEAGEKIAEKNVIHKVEDILRFKNIALTRKVHTLTKEIQSKTTAMLFSLFSSVGIAFYYEYMVVPDVIGSNCTTAVLIM